MQIAWRAEGEIREPSSGFSGGTSRSRKAYIEQEAWMPIVLGLCWKPGENGQMKMGT